jgi:branched-chain amino acid transport system substrate-binding protein
MVIGRRVLLGSAAATFAGAARAQGLPLLRVGVLTDLSGLYRDNSGPTSVRPSRRWRISGRRRTASGWR